VNILNKKMLSFYRRVKALPENEVFRKVAPGTASALKIQTDPVPGWTSRGDYGMRLENNIQPKEFK